MLPIPENQELTEIELTIVPSQERQVVESSEAPISSFNLQLLAQYLENVRQFFSNPLVLRALAGMFIIGVIIVSSTGPSTCSSFNVTNELDETLYISQLLPYSAKYRSKSNHPIWSPKSFLSTGIVQVSKGYSSEVKMRVDEYYTFGDDYFYLHFNANGKPEDFYVTGRSGLELEPKLGFFSCTVKLKNVENTNTNTTDARYLRGF